MYLKHSASRTVVRSTYKHKFQLNLQSVSLIIHMVHFYDFGARDVIRN